MGQRDGLPGGDGLSSERVIVILKGKMTAPAFMTDTDSSSSSSSGTGMLTQ